MICNWGDRQEPICSLNSSELAHHQARVGLASIDLTWFSLAGDGLIGIYLAGLTDLAKLGLAKLYRLDLVHLGWPG